MVLGCNPQEPVIGPSSQIHYRTGGMGVNTGERRAPAIVSAPRRWGDGGLNAMDGTLTVS
jgi:hypothetical protein